MKKLNKKLSLKRESLKTLSTELDSAAGGYRDPNKQETSTYTSSGSSSWP